MISTLEAHIPAKTNAMLKTWKTPHSSLSAILAMMAVDKGWVDDNIRASPVDGHPSSGAAVGRFS